MRTFAVKSFLYAAFFGAIAVGAFPGEVLAQASSAVAPTVIPVSGRLLTPEGQPRTGQVELVVALYDTHDDANPRWIEQQQVTLDAAGGYSVLFGATLADGLPVDLFTTGAGTRWLGVKDVNDTAEQPRVALVTVPYAAKAASAETLGGKAASEFMLSSTFREDLRTVLEEEGVTNGTVGSEAVTLNFLQKGDGAGGVTDSGVFENAGRIGIGTTTPATKLHVIGDVRVPTGNAYEMNTGGTSWMREVAGNLQWVSNSVERLRIDGGSGFVGIGTTTPASNLHVVGSSNGATGFQVRNTSNGTNASVSLYLGNDLDPGIGGWEMFSSTTPAAGRKAPNGMSLYGGGSGGLTLSALDANGTLRFMSGGSVERMRITSTGNIGIGTASPTARLQVAGDVVVDGNIGAKYQDVAEWVDAAEPLEAGTVVTIDTTASNRVRASRKSYDTRVAGAISPQPGIILGERGEGKVLVAQSGRVRIKADTRNGAIKPGDLLVTSPRAGYAMKAKSAKPGTVLGKALEPLDKGTGEILVLLTLQ